MIHRLPVAVLLASTLFLAACETSDERAEKHFEAGYEFYQSGDMDRARLEMRNALQLVPEHKEARLLLTEISLETGNIQRAVRNYRILLEHYPDLGEAHLALAGIAADLGDWPTVERHAGAAAKYLEPSRELEALQISLAYRQAISNDEPEIWKEQAEIGQEILETNPELRSARRLVIDALLREEQFTDALEYIDGGIAIDPDRFEYYQLRIGALQRLGLTADITTQMRDMVDRFPGESSLPPTMVRWYIQQQDLDGAETFLRERAAADPENMDRQTELAQFLRSQRGYEAVEAELTRLSEAGGSNAPTFRAMRAALMFENAQSQDAIAELEMLLQEQPEDDQYNAFANDVRVDLARMLTATGNVPDAKTLVEGVLEVDPSHVSALKLKSAWLIDDDQIDDAIVALRSALRESPRDPQIMTLMAAAHDRAGEPELKREMLALAVEASRNGPEESLRYAQELAASDNLLSAEDVLLAALRLDRANIDLYASLGNVYIRLEDWSRAEQVLNVLGQIRDQSEDPRAGAAFNALQGRLLTGQQRSEELFGFLEDLADGENRVAAEVAIIRAHITNGNVDAARERLNTALAESPEDPILRFVDASLLAVEGDFVNAETGYRKLLEENPEADQVWMALYRLYLAQGNFDGARAVLDESLETVPDSTVILFTRAGQLEATGDADGAIAIYENLYERNSSVEVVANNLASMLSTYRDTPESLDRAYRIGRRLQDSQVPAYRDTYGWIAARKGEFEEAEGHLAFALQSFPRHPVIQFHYAVALAGLGRDEEALEHFRGALEWNDGLLSPVDLSTVETEIARLEAAAASADTSEGTQSQNDSN